MSDYIDRQETIDMLMRNACEYWNQGLSTSMSHALQECAEMLENIPAADVRPVVRGKWTDHRTIEHDGEWYCTACGKEITIYMGADRPDRYRFCPNCGADMRGEIVEDTTSGCGRCDKCRINDTGTCRYGEENT